MEEKLREYAHLIVSVGLNLQKGQTLILFFKEVFLWKKSCANTRI